MNAEIVDRLEASFANLDAIRGLEARLMESERAAAKHEMNAIKDRMRSLQYLTTLSAVIEKLPDAFFEDDPKLADLVAEFRGKGNEILETGISQALADLTRFRESISEGVASGRIKVVSQEEADAHRAAKKKT
ncbi:hypothetical protein [Variovorax boronicumulans]|nr:hypothetical protein [Variovorax boronicumulans]